MATSGPGATNLLTGIGSCYFDSSPAVFITGQVNRNEQKGDRAVRQLGFQETDIVSMAAPVTKAAWRVKSVEEVPEVLARAFGLACEGRPGPVLVDIPMDIQRADMDERLWNHEEVSRGMSHERLIWIPFVKPSGHPSVRYCLRVAESGLAAPSTISGVLWTA